MVEPITISWKGCSTVIMFIWNNGVRNLITKQNAPRDDIQDSIWIHTITADSLECVSKIAAYIGWLIVNGCRHEQCPKQWFLCGRVVPLLKRIPSVKWENPDEPLDKTIHRQKSHIFNLKMIVSEREDVTYTVLATNAFNSARKRMSVLVKKGWMGWPKGRSWSLVEFQS